MWAALAGICLVMACSRNSDSNESEPEVKADPRFPEVVWSLPQRQGMSPARIPANYPEIQRTRSILYRVVRNHSLDPGNPWAISHGMLALGPDVELANGVNAVDHLFREYAEPVEGGRRKLIRFPPSKGNIRIEPHADLILKALAESGVSPRRKVDVGESTYEVGDLYRHSVSRLWVDGRDISNGDWDDTPWTLQGSHTGPKLGPTLP